MTVDPALEFRNVSLYYDASSPVLNDLSFQIAAGERVAMAGINGSGKTTLLLSCAGLASFSGEIRVAGTPLTRRTLSAVREKLGFLFNTPADQLLFPTPSEDVAFGLRRLGVPPDEAVSRAGRMLDSLGIAHLAKTPLHHLSHGQKQRVALAGALISQPSILLLDEPTAGLDPPARRELGSLLSQMPSAMLIATHDLDFIDRLCMRVLILEDGHLVSDEADTREIRRRWDCPRTS